MAVKGMFQKIPPSSYNNQYKSKYSTQVPNAVQTSKLSDLPGLHRIVQKTQKRKQFMVIGVIHKAKMNDEAGSGYQRTKRTVGLKVNK